MEGQNVIRVKPFQWDASLEVDGPFFRYRIVETGNGTVCNLFVTVPETLEDRAVTEHPTLDAAKLAANRHNAEMILSYLRNDYARNS